MKRKKKKRKKIFPLCFINKNNHLISARFAAIWCDSTYNKKVRVKIYFYSKVFLALLLPAFEPQNGQPYS